MFPDSADGPLPGPIDRLAGLPVARREGRWYLTGINGSLALPHGAFAAQLDALAESLAAADRAVARATAAGRA
jgi:hypothetical protein